jgi:hypothetical protein
VRIVVHTCVAVGAGTTAFLAIDLDLGCNVDLRLGDSTLSLFPNGP